MDDAHRQPGVGQSDDATPDLSGDIAASPSDGLPDNTDTVGDDDFDETLFEEIGALIDDGRTYAEAEIAFQKTRAKFAGRLVGTSIGLVAVALILLHIAFLALAVGLVIALAPLVTIWGAVALVFGGILLLVGLLGWMAKKRVDKLGTLFSSSDKGTDT